MGFVSGLMGAGLFVGLQIRSNAMMKVPLSRGTFLDSFTSGRSTDDTEKCIEY